MSSLNYLIRAASGGHSLSSNAVPLTVFSTGALVTAREAKELFNIYDVDASGELPCVRLLRSASHEGLARFPIKCRTAVLLDVRTCCYFPMGFLGCCQEHGCLRSAGSLEYEEVVLLLQDLSERHSGHRNVLKEQVITEVNPTSARQRGSGLLAAARLWRSISPMYDTAGMQVQHALEVLDADGSGQVTESDFVGYFTGRPLSSVEIFGTQQADSHHPRRKGVSRAADLDAFGG